MSDIWSVLITFIEHYGVYLLVLPALVTAALLWKEFYRVKFEIESFEPNSSNSENDFNKHFEKICLNRTACQNGEENMLILKKEPSSFLVNIAKQKLESSILYGVPTYFTGAALAITFLLIGEAVHKIGISLPEINKTNLELLGNPIADLQQKFFVSIAGILSTIVLQVFRNVLKAILLTTASKTFDLRKKLNYEVLEEHDIVFKKLQSKSAQNSLELLSKMEQRARESYLEWSQDKEEIKDLLKDLKNIDVTVGSFAENVTTRLEDFIDKSVGEKLTELIRAQNIATERMASELGKALANAIGSELKDVFIDLSQSLPKIMSTGASEATTKMTGVIEKAADSFQILTTALPSLTSNLQNMLNQAEKYQLSAGENLAKQNQEMIDTMSRMLASIAPTTENILSTAKNSADLFADNFNEKGALFNSRVANASLELDNAASNINETVSNLSTFISEFQKTLFEVKDTTITVSNINKDLKHAATIISEVGQKLLNVPDLTKTLVVTTTHELAKQRELIDISILQFMKSREEGLRAVSDQYSKGLEQLTETFVAKIQEIEGQTKNIREIYKGAGSSLRDAIEPIEDLNESIQALNSSLKSKAS